jgi:hypothetical protein
MERLRTDFVFTYFLTMMPILIPTMMRLRSRALILCLTALLSACVTESAKFDHSPCAGCDFQPLNTVLLPGAPSPKG